MVLGSSPGGGIRVRAAAWAAAAVLVLGTAATACGDDDDGGAPPPKPPAESTPTAPAEPTPTPSAPADPAAAEQEIRENWVKFFDPKVSLQDKEAVLENGAKMRPVLQAFSGDQRGRQVAAEVSKVKFTSATQAEVTYSLALQGQTVMPSATGTAVEQDGTWKVSVKTLCALVQLSGNASPVPGC
ncbi:hypothetical protein [Streptomyces sp. NPDC002851]